MDREGKVTKNNIILTGFMGTGKTTVGKLLAAQLDYEFIDTDILIQTRQARSIPQIFRQSGEAAFRQMEAAVAEELASREGVVIATGGRMMLDPANAATLSRQGQVFCLVAAPEEILTRLKGDATQPRPLLEGANPGQRIVELLQQRAQGYQRFPQVMTDNKQPTDVVQELLALIQNERFANA
jgi:shikimate kinase